MNNKTTSIFSNVVKCILISSIALASCDAFSATKYRKVVKDGKVTYLPVKESTATPKAAPISSTASDASSKKRDQTSKKKTPSRPKEITLYESNSCNDCRRIRRFFYSNELTYDRKDIDLNKQYNFELAQKTGNRKTPALFVDNKRVNDLSNENLRKLFKINAPKPIKKSKPNNNDKELNSKSSTVRSAELELQGSRTRNINR